MKVTVDQLEEGDEIILSGCDLYYAKVVRKPLLRKGVTKHWRTGNPIYKAVKLMIGREEHTSPSGYKYTTIVCDPTNLNSSVFRDLNYKEIWLVKRETK